MKESTRKRKEGLMLQAAARIMERKGLTNFTMEEVAEEAYVTKVTLYTYFTSKENLIMAVCHKIYADLSARLDSLEESLKNVSGVEACVKLKSEILNFITEQSFRAVMLMEFMSVYDLPESKLSSAMAHSPYRLALNDETIKIVDRLNRQLVKGKNDKDGTIGCENNIPLQYIWNCISGFITLVSTPFYQKESAQSTLIALADFHAKTTKQILLAESTNKAIPSSSH